MSLGLYLFKRYLYVLLMYWYFYIRPTDYWRNKYFLYFIFERILMPNFTRNKSLWLLKENCIAQSYAPPDVFVWRKQHQMEVTVHARIVTHQPIRIEEPARSRPWLRLKTLVSCLTRQHFWATYRMMLNHTRCSKWGGGLCFETHYNDVQNDVQNYCIIEKRSSMTLD